MKTLYRKIGENLFGVFVAIFIAYTGVFSYWLFWPFQPLVITGPIEILNKGKVVKAGDVLIYRIQYEKKINITGKLVRKLINDTKIDLRDSDANAPIGKDKDCVPIHIPQYATPGKYHLWWSVTYKVNPIREITVSKESEEFEVIK
jgi:hypothetical protein